MKNESIIAAVIALLKGIEVDGETMQHIIEEVNMGDQMKKQLGVSGRMPQSVIDQLAEDISNSISNEGTEAISDYELSMSRHEVELDDVTFDDYVIKKAVENALSEHFIIDEEE